MKRSFISYCLLFLALGLNYSSAQNSEADSFYNEGNKLLKAGNFKDAITLYDKALNIKKDYRIYYQKGVAYKRANELDSAKVALDECIKLKPDFEGSYNALGSIYYSMGNFESAVANYEKVVQMSKDTSVISTAKFNLSRAYTMLGDAASKSNKTKAVEYFQKAVENDNYDKAYLLLAKLYSESKEFDKTIAAAENALKYKANISEGGPYYYLGLAYKSKGDLIKAKEMFSLAKNDEAYKKAAEYELSLLK
ncbi:MAG: tetratricopeptide repeat protein [Ignavibacteria bacterium]|nr:tetratricopeptide repeat protein [Ignavibacteria bacterium]